MLGVELLCEGMKFKKDFTIVVLDGFDVILSNLFLDAYYIDILKSSYKLRIRIRLANKSVSLEVDH